MNKEMALRIAKRFITLPLDKRRQFLTKMQAEGVSPVNLPIPQMKDEVDCIPLSFAQERQWFLWQLDPVGSAYHVSTALRMRGPLDMEALGKSFNLLLSRHETLRTVFTDTLHGPVQTIKPHARLEVIQHELSCPAGQELRPTITRFIEEQTRPPFDLLHGPLLRIASGRLDKDDYVLVLTQHHIVSDAASLQIMVRELVEHYGVYSKGLEPQLPALPVQYSDYAIWQRRWMEAGERDRQLGYWINQLGQESPVLDLPLDRPRPVHRNHQGARVRLQFQVEATDGIRRLAQKHAATPFMVLLASWFALLHRYSGQDDVRVGVPVANRNRVETEGLIGFFVNTQVYKGNFSEPMTFSKLLGQVRQTALEAQTYQELPFGDLVEALKTQRDLSISPLFQVLFNHSGSSQPILADNSQSNTALTVENLDWDTQTAQFDLTLDTVESAEGFSASLTYATDVFDTGTVERLARHWQNLLRALVADPDQRIGSLAMLDPDEQQASLAEWNPAPQRFDSVQCIHQLIEAQAARVPDAIAVSFDGQQLSYAQLNVRANQLARALVEQGIGAETLVGLAVERGLEMIVGLLAILKAGGAYVPLDPAYPEDRLAYM
ncbi:condensation domain-containing protein, partial [Pseudomonas alabamensis]|uniref:condensation domain-containing protein n=1 Tax=Pseudomonas alabamensis TaxID=3064349 RepID=UPI003F64EBFC